MNALRSLEPAIRRGLVVMQPCELHRDLQVLRDVPDGITPRFTYAKVSAAGTVEGIAMLGVSEPIDGVPTFGLGYAIAEPFRGNGLAAEIANKAIEEFRNGAARNGLIRFFIEAVVGINNGASNATARKIFPDAPRPGTDAISGQPILAYVKVIE